MTDKVQKQLFNAIFKSMIGRYSVYILNLLSMMVLARLFTPESFGIVSSVFVIYVFFQVLSEAGIGPAIININKISKEDKNGIFSLTLIVGLASSLLFFLLSDFISNFYRIDGVEIVIPYVALTIIFFTLNILPLAFLQREKSFYSIAIGAGIAELVSTTIVIILHYFIDPLNALASKSAIMAFIILLLNWYFCKNTDFGRPLFGTKINAIKPFLNFAKFQFGFNFVNYFSRNLDNILVGKYMGAEYLGVYEKSYQLMKYPLLLLSFAMTPAIQPVLRDHSNDLEAVEVIHRNFTFKLSLLASIAGSLLYFLSGFIVFITLGHQWDDVVPILKILAISIPCQVVLSTSGSFFLAMGRSDIQFYSGLISALFMVIAIVLGISSGKLEELCMYLVCAFILNYFQSYYFLHRLVLFASPIKFYISSLPMITVTLILIYFEFFNL